MTKKISKENRNAGKKFIKSVFSDPDSNEWSWARLTCTFIILLVLVLLLVLALKNGQIPERTSELLTGAAAIVGLIYGSNKVANAISTRSEDK